MAAGLDIPLPTRAAVPTNSAEILNGALNFAFLDLGREGAIGGLIVGVPPQTIRNDIAANEDPGTTIHIEANYQFPVNRFITITPGLIYLINPEADDSNGDVFVGVIRTTFKILRGHPSVRGAQLAVRPGLACASMWELAVPPAIP